MKKPLPAAILCAAVLVLCLSLGGQEERPLIRLGMIGLDTSHVVAFTKYINGLTARHGCRVVAAWPGAPRTYPPRPGGWRATPAG